MSDSSLKIEEFKVVAYKRNKAKSEKIKNKLISICKSVPSKDFNLEFAVRRIETAKIELRTSDLYSSVLASLREGLKILNSPKITEIVCFGLGKIDIRRFSD
ncbi:hypothetical protein RN001_006274 [Aquatica leii]|uniref:Uncharacterized protein n=1 Tax=Aquatica leii TaxID=1421715 RepID=A0AAN7P7P7_9COLE|nr:hypothetical protein RN001_006274 [Aquatica leii]